MPLSEIYMGPMFARKTQAIEGRLEDAVIAEEAVLVIRPKIDERVERTIFTRISENQILANYSRITMVTVGSEKDFWRAVRSCDPNVVAIDECQFFDSTWFVQAIKRLLDEHSGDDAFLVLMAGLDTNYQRKSFGPMPKLTCEVADKIHKLRAICNKCKRKTAVFTSRKTKEPGEILLGGKNEYEALCRKCWPK